MIVRIRFNKGYPLDFEEGELNSLREFKLKRVENCLYREYEYDSSTSEIFKFYMRLKEFGYDTKLETTGENRIYQMIMVKEKPEQIKYQDEVIIEF